jgi:histone-binding protein RBBP4
MTSTNVSMDQRIINEDYKIWKRNTPFLYDIVMTHALEWPSLTVSWLPDKQVHAAAGHSSQSLLLGTHTGGNEKNFLMVAEVKLPLDDTEVDARKYNNGGTGGGDGADYGGYGGDAGRVEITQRILHDGEVNRARHMPQNAQIVATKTTTADIYIFDRAQHEAEPAKDAKFAPQARLQGHSAEGYGVAWSPLTKGRIASGSDDAKVCVWDVDVTAAGGGGGVKATRTFTGHSDVVEDVVGVFFLVASHNVRSLLSTFCSASFYSFAMLLSGARTSSTDTNLFAKQQQSHFLCLVSTHTQAWHCYNDHLLGSCGHDKVVCLWDARAPSSDKATTVINAHSKEVNCLAFSPHDEFLLLTGGADKSVALWDLRSPNAKLHSFENHQEQIFQVRTGSGRALCSCSSSSHVTSHKRCRSAAHTCHAHTIIYAIYFCVHNRCNGRRTTRPCSAASLYTNLQRTRVMLTRSFLCNFVCAQQVQWSPHNDNPTVLGCESLHKHSTHTCHAHTIIYFYYAILCVHNRCNGRRTTRPYSARAPPTGVLMFGTSAASARSRRPRTRRTGRRSCCSFTADTRTTSATSAGMLTTSGWSRASPTTTFCKCGR